MQKQTSTTDFPKFSLWLKEQSISEPIGKSERERLHEEYRKLYQKQYHQQYKRKKPRKIVLQLSEREQRRLLDLKRLHQSLSEEQKQLSLAAFVTEVVEGFTEQRVVHRNPELVRELGRLLRSATNNINQVAHRANRRGYVTSGDVYGLKTQVEQMQNDLDTYMNKAKDLEYSIQQALEQDASFAEVLEYILAQHKNQSV